MDRTKMAQKQMALATHAQAQPDHQFTNLYSLLHWDYWIRCAAEAVLARPGSSTAGVDGHTRRSFRENEEQRIAELVEGMKRKTYTPQAVRRTYIPKSNGKMRPLGIPTLNDRIVQEALRAILDPIYESDFQHHSYGFRKGRRTMDAIAVIMPLMNSRAKHYYVIEGDIKSYFDNVHHRKLMSILRRRIADKAILDLIWKFLKAGVMEGGLFAQTKAGVPQGGVISPLLANVYLNEFDAWAEQRWNLSPYERAKRRKAGQGNYTMVRYADDFVVMSNARISDVQQTKEEIKHFLATELHLELSVEKTQITHVNAGFTFLGFHLQRVKTREGRWVMYERPSAEGKARIKRKLKSLTTSEWKWMDEFTRLSTLNVIVKGWAEYYRHTGLLRDIEEVTRYTWYRYLAWLRKRHEQIGKRELIRTRTRVIHHRTRWVATIREGAQSRETYQWLPTRRELRRSRYLNKGRNGFPHPYIFEQEPLSTDYPTGTTGPAEAYFVDLVGVPNSEPSRNEPLEMAELILRAKVRDGFRCQRCGSRDNLQVHHTKGTKTHRLETLETLCKECHATEHRPKK